MLEDGWLGETKGDLMGGQLLVDMGDGVNLALHEGLVQWVEEHLLLSLTIEAHSKGFAGDVGWEALYLQIKQLIILVHNYILLC